MKIRQLFFSTFLAGLVLFSSCHREGCTDPEANNYDKRAKKDDGTCSYPLKVGAESGGGWCDYIGPGIENYHHVLIIGKVDISSGAPWGCAGTQIRPYSYGAIGQGPDNTTAICGHCTETGIAAQLCTNYVVGTNAGWCLPSQTELSMLASERSFVTGIVDGANYWTSTEVDADHAVAVAFSASYPYGYSYVTLPKATLCRVRPGKYFYSAF
jgi:hypothetical protein